MVHIPILDSLGESIGDEKLDLNVSISEVEENSKTEEVKNAS